VRELIKGERSEIRNRRDEKERDRIKKRETE
jgi:hypothetical protein